jgi:hypothetical protein
VYGMENFAVCTEDRREKTRHCESIAVTVLSNPVEGAMVADLLQSRCPLLNSSLAGPDYGKGLALRCNTGAITGPSIQKLHRMPLVHFGRCAISTSDSAGCQTPGGCWGGPTRRSSSACSINAADSCKQHSASPGFLDPRTIARSGPCRSWVTGIQRCRCATLTRPRRTVRGALNELG